jgi:hypothetical protein
VKTIETMMIPANRETQISASVMIAADAGIFAADPRYAP